MPTALVPTALVIGGRRGIGAAVVNALAEAGFDITYTTRTNDPAHHEALTTRHPTRTFITHNLDLANRDSVESFATEIEDAPPYAALIHVSENASMAVVIFRPATSRGTGEPCKRLPFSMIDASRQPTNKLGM